MDTSAGVILHVSTVHIDKVWMVSRLNTTVRYSSVIIGMFTTFWTVWHCCRYMIDQTATMMWH